MMSLTIHILTIGLSLSILWPSAGADCPAAKKNTCVHILNNVYQSYTTKKGLDECCQECTLDADLCAGFTYIPSPSGKSAQCHLLDFWNVSAVQKGNCTSGQVNVFPSPPAPKKPTTPPAGAKNVLFLIADDMRPSIGPYGFKDAYTPNLDRLAQGGLTFSRAYVQFSYCAPSRNSFMSGRRPDANKVYSFMGHFRQYNTGMNWTALPEHFRNNGYTVAGAGKLFHPNVPPNFDQPRSWSAEFPYMNKGDNKTNLCNETCCGAEDSSHWCMWDLAPNHFLSDQRNTEVAKSYLRTAAERYKKMQKPFFIGLGFHKPHLRWDFPKEFLEKIPVNVSTAKHQAFPADVPHLAWHECAECSATGKGTKRFAYFDTNGMGTPLPPDEWQQKMRRAYYACIAYVDSLIGEMLDLLDELDVADDTVVSFSGDHGWNLGEHDIWCKMTNFELGTRVPFIFRAPWKTNSTGKVTKALSELVDFFPTLSELAGLELPSGEGGAHLGGTSLIPVFDNPESSVKDVALSQFPRCWQNNTGYDSNGLNGPGDERNHTVSWESMSDCHWVRSRSIDFMGYTMRTDEYRYTEWVKWDGKHLKPLWNQLIGTELYDHRHENQFNTEYMDETENENMAWMKQYADLVKTLSKKLHTEVEKWIV